MQKLFGLGAKNIVLGVLRKFVFQTEKFGFPNITGCFTAAYQSRGNFCDGAFARNGTKYYQEVGVNYQEPCITFDSSRVSFLYSNSSTVQPFSLRILIVVRI